MLIKKNQIKKKKTIFKMQLGLENAFLLQKIVFGIPVNSKKSAYFGQFLSGYGFVTLTMGFFLMIMDTRATHRT